MKQDREIADLLWDLVREHGDRGHDAQMNIRHERRGDQHTIEHVVKAIADQDQRRRCGVAIASCDGSCGT